MDTELKIKSNVIWCDASDVTRLDNASFLSEPDTWDTYEEFFTELIETEEEDN